MEVGGVDLTGQAEQLVAAGGPPARRFAACVVVLDTVGDGVEVVRLLTGSEFPDAQHGRDRPPPTLAGTSRTRVQIRELESGVIPGVTGIGLATLQGVARSLSNSERWTMGAWDASGFGRGVTTVGAAAAVNMMQGGTAIR